MKSFTISIYMNSRFHIYVYIAQIQFQNSSWASERVWQAGMTNPHQKNILKIFDFWTEKKYWNDKNPIPSRLRCGNFQSVFCVHTAHSAENEMKCKERHRSVYLS